MGSKLAFSNRRKLLLVAAVVCVVLIASITIWWQTGQVAQAAIVDPHPGLVGWWRFDEGSGTVAGDSSENGNNCTISGASWVTGRYGQALSFDGANAYAKVLDSASLDVTSTITISAWVNCGVSPVGSYRTITRKESAYAFRFDEYGNLQGFVWIGGVPKSSNLVPAVIAWVPNTWVHWVFVFDGAYLRIYKNGVEIVNPKAQTGLVDVTTADLGIGATGTAYAAFKGVLDEVCIYNRALSAKEIQAGFQKSPDFSSNLLAVIPKGTTQVTITFSWQGSGTINATVMSPSQNYTEDTLPKYQKTVYSTSGGTSGLLNIKRLTVSVNALSSDQNWYVLLTYDNIDAYQIAVEAQK